MNRYRLPPGYFIISNWLFLFLLLVFFLPLFSQGTQSPDKKVSQKLSEVKRVEKTNLLVINGKEITYRLIFDCMPVKTDSLTSYSGRMCYNAYLIEKPNPSRPVSFFFNGGPGAASVYLNFGVAGPKIIKPQIDKKNFIFPNGTRLEDNPYSWIDRSDLVFIDPVGTGFSHVIPDKKEEEPKVLKNFWGVHEDLQSLTHFIRLWVTDNNRWLAPKVLVGESYGGLRAGALAKYLLDKTGISPAGVIMVSPALNLWLIREQSTVSLSPWLRLLPSLIHTAQYYQKGNLSPLPPSKNSGDIEERIEVYLLREYLPKIAQGNALNPRERRNFYQSLSLLTGLKEDIITQKNGRISFALYSKNILDDGLVISPYDGTVAYPDPYPRSWHYGQDTYLTTISAAFHTVANHYYRDELGINGLREFHVLNTSVNASWKYPGSSKSVETFSDLEAGLNANPKMKTLIVHGRHDLITPYYTSRYLILQSSLPQAQDKIRLQLYDGGHMFYLNSKSLKAFNEDSRAFYQQINNPKKR